MTGTRLKVLQIGKYYPPYRGGMESHLETLCLSLRNEVDFEIAVANTSRRRLQELNGGLPVTRLGAAITAGSMGITPELVPLLAHSRADVIHLHLPNPWAALAFLLSRSTAPLVVTHHSDIVRQRVMRRVYSPVEDAIAERAAALIATSQNAIHFSPTLSRFQAKCRIVPLGVTDEAFRLPPSGAVAEIKRELGERLVLYVGRLVYYKGADYLVRAMKNVRGRLLIVGKGPLEATLKELVRAESLGDRIRLLGDVSPETLKALYHAAEVFVLPSVAKSEAFGLVQVEAMAAGLPVVNTNIPSGVPYVSLHGETGTTVEPHSPEALAEAITELLDNPELRAFYGARARRRAERLFHARVMARDTLAVYRSVAVNSGYGRVSELELPAEKAFSVASSS